jgi:hypothetical protein
VDAKKSSVLISRVSGLRMGAQHHVPMCDSAIAPLPRILARFIQIAMQAQHALSAGNRAGGGLLKE